MKKMQSQMTIRNVPLRVREELRSWGKREGRSLNGVALEVLKKGLGLEGEPIRYHDLDHLAGTWVEDPACDKALEEMDKVDKELWK